MSQCEQITLSCHQGVLLIGINREQKKNALTRDMYKAIGQALLGADDNPQIKVIILHGTPACFSSGNDLQEFVQRDPNQPSAASELLLILHNLSKPLIAAVNTLAVGIGATILLHCDLVYAAHDTRFKLPFVDLGVCPEAASSLLLAATVGHRKAAEVLLLADFFDAKKAVELGLVNQLIAPGQVLEHAREVALQLSLKPVQALLATKALLKQADHQRITQRMQQEFQLFNKLLESEESIAARGRLTAKQVKL